MISPSFHPSRNELRTFGWAALVAFGIGGWMLHWQFGLVTLPWIFWILGALAGLLALLNPYRVYPIYLIVTLVSLPIGLVLSNLVLGLIFFGVLTPMAWALRLRRRDPLRIAKPELETYWRERTRRPEPASYYRQS